MSASGTAKKENQATPSASRQTVAQLIARLDPEMERYRQTAGVTDRGDFTEGVRDKNSSVSLEKTETIRVGDNQAKETGLKGSEGLNGQDIAGGGLSAVEKQAPGSPLQIQVGSSNWQQPSKVSRSPSRSRWSFSRRRESRRLSRVRDSRSSPSDATAKGKISDTLVDHPSTVAGEDGNTAQAQQASSLPPRPSSGEILGKPAGENVHPHRNFGLPPRPVSWGAAIKGTSGADECRSPLARFENEVSSSSREVLSRVEGSTKLSTAASSAAATATAVLGGDLRTKSESALSADVGFSCDEKHGITQDNPASSQPGQAAAITAPLASTGEVVSGGDRRPTPVRGKSLFSSGGESRSQRKGSGFIQYFKGPLRSTGADRSTTNEVIPKGAHGPNRDSTPSSTPGTGRKASTSFSNPGKWRPRSIPMQRSRDNSIRPGALEGEGQIKTMDVPSGISGLATVSGSDPTARCISDSGKVDDDDNNLNIGVMRPESAMVMSSEGRVNRDHGPSVAPEDGQEDVHGMEEKEGSLGVEEELEGEGEELEAVISDSCSFLGRLECGRALRIEGKFAGDLVSTGSITIGPTGTVAGDLNDIKFLMVDGQLTGNVVCDSVVIGKFGKIFGNITSESITMGPQATIRGMLTIVDDISQARAEIANKGETQTKEENGEGLESGVAQGGAGTEEAAVVGANTELKSNEGTKGDEHENQDLDDDVLPFEGGEGDSGGLDKFDSAAVARAAEEEAKVAEEEAKPVATEVTMAREDERAEAEEEAKPVDTEVMMAREDERAEAEVEGPTSSEC